MITEKGFDSEKYLKLQSEHISERISKFGKLYLEFGGKLFDDMHASRVLPGFLPDNKIVMLESIRDTDTVTEGERPATRNARTPRVARAE